VQGIDQLAFEALLRGLEERRSAGRASLARPCTIESRVWGLGFEVWGSGLRV
jgi:hypothetical protein